MGYGTRYTITKVDGDAALFRKAFEMYLQAHPDTGVRWFGILKPSESMTWYGHEEQIVSAMSVCDSTAVTLVELHGEGEEQGDVWDKEFRRDLDGKIVVQKYRYRMVREECPE